MRSGDRRVRELREKEAAAALRAAVEHVNAAVAERDRLPKIGDDPGGHAEAVMRLHAHLKAADSFLESYRSAQPLNLAGDGPPPLPAPAPVTPTRARAAILLNMAGNVVEAARLVGSRPPRKGS